MKKTYPLNNLDCAHCAQKMEDAIRELEGVQEVRVNFLAQKLVLTTESDSQTDIMKKVVKVCHKIEPDCEIVL